MDKSPETKNLVSNFKLKDRKYLEINNHYNYGITCTTQWRNVEGKSLSLKW